MSYDLTEIIDILESLLEEDLSSKSKSSLLLILNELKEPIDLEKLLKIQDDLEYFSNTANVDSFVRNEIMNIIAENNFYFFIILTKSS